MSIHSNSHLFAEKREKGDFFNQGTVGGKSKYEGSPDFKKHMPGLAE
jgi:hypothetical protein